MELTSQHYEVLAGYVSIQYTKSTFWLIDKMEIVWLNIFSASYPSWSYRHFRNTLILTIINSTLEENWKYSMEYLEFAIQKQSTIENNPVFGAVRFW